MSVNSLVAYGEMKRKQLEEMNGFAAFQVLVGADGILNASLIEGKYGPCWLLKDEDDVELYGRKFIPHDGSHKGEGIKDVSGEEIKFSKSKVQAQLGLQQMYELAPAAYSRNRAELYRTDWVEYGNWMGDLWVSPHDNFINPEMVEKAFGKEV